MSVKKTIKSFVEEASAIITGNDAKATAIKMKRQADSALNSELYAKRGRTIHLEDAVEAAEEMLHLVTYNNGETIKDSPQYVRNLIHAQNSLIEAKEALEDHLAVIKFLEERLEVVNFEEK